MFAEQLYVCDAFGSLSTVLIRDEFSDVCYVYVDNPLTDQQITFLTETGALPDIFVDKVNTQRN